MNAKEPRLKAPQYLRGVAALLVVLAHWSTAFTPTGLYAHSGFTAPAPAVELWLTGAVDAMWHVLSLTWLLGINLASGGVLIFFLISGFVIPLSAERLSFVSFATRRAFRIYPSLWAMFALAVILHFTALALGMAHQLPLGPQGLVVNALLIPGTVDLDPVMWTLSVEIMFYIVAALMVLIAKKVSAAPIVVAATVVAGFGYLALHAPQFAIFRLALPCILFMLIGATLHLWYFKRMGIIAALALSACLFVPYAWLVLGKGDIDFYVEDGAKAFLLFLGAIAVERAGVKLPLKPLAWAFDGLGAISYPLYLLHGVVGIGIIMFAFHFVGDANAATAVAAVIVFALCWLVHVTIEGPGQKLGARIGRALDRAVLRLRPHVKPT